MELEIRGFCFVSVQTESRKTFEIRALADSVLEGDQSFSARLLPDTSGEAVIDPLNGLYSIYVDVLKKDAGVQTPTPDVWRTG